MVIVGTDVHKRTHTFVAVDEVGRKLGEKVVPATTAGHQKALGWAREQFGGDLLWGIEDCRNLSARLERSAHCRPKGGAGSAQAHVPDQGLGTDAR